MKKLLSVIVLLSSFLLFSIAVNVAVGEAASGGQSTTYLVAEDSRQKVEFAEPAVSQDRVLQIAREMFPDLFEGKDIDVQLQDYFMGDGSWIWQLNWSESAPGGRRTEYFDVGIDADTGALVSLYYSNPSAVLEGGATPLTEEAARQKAEEYAKKYRQAEFSRTRPAESEYYGYYPRGMMKNTYTFFWERVENGIPVEGDGINVGVDLFSGRMVNFTANWHSDAVFPQPGSLPEGLENRVLQDVGFILCYQVSEGVKQSLTGVPEASLYYQLNSPDRLKISPNNGEAFTWDGKTIPLSQYKRFSALPAPADSNALTESTGSITRPAQKISQAVAQQAAREFFKKIGIDQEVVRGGGGSSGGGVFYDETWSYHLKEENNLKPCQMRQRIVGIDVFSGDVSNYHAFSQYGGDGQSADNAQKVTRDVVCSRAVDFIRLIEPERWGQVVEEEQHGDYPEGQEGYAFNFIRLVNGIPFTRDGIIINFDSGGEIIGYNCNWHAVKFPSVAGLITKEEAEKVFQEKMRLKPFYFFPLEGDPLRPGKQPMLALMFDSYRNMGIDARTGQLVAVNMMAVQSEGKPGAVVPPEHWAAVSLSVLANSGLLPAEGFNPDGAVSRRDAVRVLMSVAGGDYGYSSSRPGSEKASFADVAPNDQDYNVIQTAVRRGVLADEDRFFPEQPLSREELTVWLVRALGYGDVAGMPVKIELKAADAAKISEQSLNYVAIAWGLGLLEGDENSLFRPADQATWAELASLVTRAAPRLRSAGEW